MTANTLLIIVGVLLLLFNLALMIINYYFIDKKGKALLNAFSAGFVFSVLLSLIFK